MKKQDSSAAMDFRRIAVVGAGTVGASWAAFFLSRGLEVAVFDPQPEREDFVRRYIESAQPVLARLGGNVGNRLPQRWTFTTSMAEAVACADYVQESVPDDLALKRAVFVQLDELVPSTVLIASSTSSLLLTDLQEGLRTPARFVVAHPFNPPHLIPVVELVGGRASDPQCVERCGEFLASLGKVIVRLRREVVGHLVNRMQAALFREAVWLVEQGVADVADIDRGIAFGPGLRWAAMGPFLTFHLAARDGGMRAYLENLGGAHERMWSNLGAIEKFTPQLVRQIAAGVEAEAGDVSIDRLVEYRDEIIVRILGKSLAGTAQDVITPQE